SQRLRFRRLFYVQLTRVEKPSLQRQLDFAFGQVRILHGQFVVRAKSERSAKLFRGLLEVITLVGFNTLFVEHIRRTDSCCGFGVLKQGKNFWGELAGVE